jgi:hypothetical protein
MLDTLENPVEVAIPLRGLRMRAVVEIEQEVLDFFGEQTRNGARIRDKFGKDETPSEWFVSRLTTFVRNATLRYIEPGSDARTAVSRAVVDACSYAAPAYYVGRALELIPQQPHLATEINERLLSYLRRHPEQCARLSDEDHLRAVPSIEVPLRRLVAAA